MQYYLAILVICLFSQTQCATTTSDDIEYYVNLVENGINDSYAYVNPTNADQYRPRHILPLSKY